MVSHPVKEMRVDVFLGSLSELCLRNRVNKSSKNEEIISRLKGFQFPRRNSGEFICSSKITLE